MSSISLLNTPAGGDPGNALFQALLVRSAQGDYQAKALLDRLARPQQGSDLPAMQASGALPQGDGSEVSANSSPLPPMRGTISGGQQNPVAAMGDYFLTHDPLRGLGGEPADQAPDAQPTAPDLPDQQPPAPPPRPDLPPMAGAGAALLRMPPQPATAPSNLPAMGTPGNTMADRGSPAGMIDWLKSGGLQRYVQGVNAAAQPPAPDLPGSNQPYQPPANVVYADQGGTSPTAADGAYQPPSNVVLADSNGGPGVTLPPMAGPDQDAPVAPPAGPDPMREGGLKVAYTPPDQSAQPEAPMSPDGRPLPPMRRTASVSNPNLSTRRVVVTPAQAEASPAEQQQAPAVGSPPGAPVMVAPPSLAFGTPNADREGGIQTGYIPPAQNQPPMPDNAPLPGMTSGSQPAAAPQLAAPAKPAPADDGRNTLFGMRMPSNQALRQLAILSGGISQAAMRPGTTALGAIGQGGAALAAHQDQQDLAKAKLGLESRKVDVEEKTALSQIQMHYDQLNQMSQDRRLAIEERQRAASDANATRQIMVQMQSQNVADRTDAMRQWHSMMASSAADRAQTAAEAAADRKQAAQDRNDRLSADSQTRADTAAAARDTANQRAQETANRNYDAARTGYLKQQTDPITGQAKPGAEDAADAYAAKAHPKAEASQAWYQSQLASQSALADQLKTAAQQKFGSDAERLKQEYDRIDKALGNTLDPLKRVFEK